MCNMNKFVAVCCIVCNVNQYLFHGTLKKHKRISLFVPNATFVKAQSTKEQCHVQYNFFREQNFFFAQHTGTVQKSDVFRKFLVHFWSFSKHFWHTFFCFLESICDVFFPEKAQTSNDMGNHFVYLFSKHKRAISQKCNVTFC